MKIVTDGWPNDARCRAVAVEGGPEFLRVLRLANFDDLPVFPLSVSVGGLHLLDEVNPRGPVERTVRSLIDPFKMPSSPSEYVVNTPS